MVAIPAKITADWKFSRPAEHDFAIAAKATDVGDTPNCVLCEFLMKQLEAELKDKKTDAEIEHAVKSICHVMPKTINAQCSKFVDQYAELVIQLLATTPPKAICSNMMLCSATPPREESKSNSDF